MLLFYITAQSCGLW